MHSSCSVNSPKRVWMPKLREMPQPGPGQVWEQSDLSRRQGSKRAWATSAIHGVEGHGIGKGHRKARRGPRQKGQPLCSLLMVQGSVTPWNLGEASLGTDATDGSQATRCVGWQKARTCCKEREKSPGTRMRSHHHISIAATEEFLMVLNSQWVLSVSSQGERSGPTFPKIICPIVAWAHWVRRLARVPPDAPGARWQPAPSLPLRSLLLLAASKVKAANYLSACGSSSVCTCVFECKFITIV